MPVILELEKYEAELVVDALMEGRIRLMKDGESAGNHRIAASLKTTSLTSTPISWRSPIFGSA